MASVLALLAQNGQDGRDDPQNEVRCTFFPAQRERATYFAT
jgi:hypothetical protein